MTKHVYMDTELSGCEKRGVNVIFTPLSNDCA